MQVDGMAQAIRAPEIVAAIKNGRHGRIGFAVFLWAAGDFPELASWRVIGSPQDAEAASNEISSRVGKHEGLKFRSAATRVSAGPLFFTLPTAFDTGRLGPAGASWRGRVSSGSRIATSRMGFTPCFPGSLDVYSLRKRRRYPQSTRHSAHDT